MACNCKDKTVLDFMDDNKVQADDSDVINYLLDAMAALDNQRAEENPTDLQRIAAYRAMHSKLDATIKYIKARLKPHGKI